MLFKLNMTDKSLDAVPYADLARLAHVEKDLENLMAENLFGTLFEEPPLFPFFQERSMQPEADIYALSARGDLVIFELKRSVADRDALSQLLGYAQKASQWRYADLQRMYCKYGEQSQNVELAEAHQLAFALEVALPEADFNREQHLWIVGNAADAGLVAAVDYWKRQGLSIDFFPYRVYELGSELHFEFFAKPYDTHTNPGDRKGVLFDTNRTYDESALKTMLRKKRISTFGGNEAVKYLARGDLVFYTHVGVGVVCAGEVRSSAPKKDDSAEQRELYHDVTFCTPIPEEVDDKMQAMPFRRVQEVTGKSFYWATTAKTPYLNFEEAEKLRDELNEFLAEPSATR